MDSCDISETHVTIVEDFDTANDGMCVILVVVVNDLEMCVVESRRLWLSCDFGAGNNERPPLRGTLSLYYVLARSLVYTQYLHPLDGRIYSVYY
jgi:hypothetical protein